MADMEINIKQIAEDAYDVVSEVAGKRTDLMSEIKSAVTSNDTNISMDINGNGAEDVDISTGAGALILDDYLQELSTVEQAAAQFVAAENKAQKQIHSVTGQG